MFWHDVLTMVHTLLILLALILESLPISSSGHMVLLEPVLGALPQALDQLLHGPFALVITFAFARAWLPIAQNPYAYRRPILKLFKYVVIVDAITLAAFIFKNSLPAISLWAGFFITSIALLSLYLLRNRRPPYRSCTTNGAVLLGIVQSLSLLPGISRFGTTYATARWLGLRPDRAIQLSFLLHLPLTCGGLLLGVYKGALAGLSPAAYVAIALGTLGATALLLLMQRLATRRMLWVFGIYLLVLQMLAFFMC